MRDEIVITMRRIKLTFNKKKLINLHLYKCCSLLLDSGGEDGGGLSQGAEIAVAAALVLFVIALSLGAVMCFIKRKRKPKTDAFTLLDNDQCDFVNANTVTIGDSY